VPNVVLVHGGFVDGSGWQGVYDLLTRDGYNVAVVQNPTQSLAGDVAAFMAGSQTPWGVDALTGAVSEPAWRHRPSWYLVAADDKMIPSPAQRAFHGGRVRRAATRSMCPSRRGGRADRAGRHHTGPSLTHN
jgi:hypothetical protein